MKKKKKTTGILRSVSLYVQKPKLIESLKITSCLQPQGHHLMPSTSYIHNYMDFIISYSDQQLFYKIPVTI